MPINTFRYLASGGSNFLLDVIIYFISFNFILQKQDVIISDNITISAHIFALLISFMFVIPYGFLMSKFIVFQESNLKGRIQLFRYLVIVGVNVILNYVLMKIFVEVIYLFPTVARITTAILIAIFSYIINQRFSFGKTSNTKKSRVSV